ncbi:hypothetical protein SGRA_2939 [Saprospira grandis str. Lewin]|uniref:Uncharacterized protein n=1 Tax=Saprospira grandis (strain Lewin) TaxID=984262 RepID=H6LAS4_SAPGL|nr:hypothetical protein SGRA_2939 [Saprospira grandis str. Lewin]
MLPSFLFFYAVSIIFWGLRCGFALRRYVSGLAIRSALRGLRPLGLACGHPCTSLGQERHVARRPFGPKWALAKQKKGCRREIRQPFLPSYRLK